MRLTKEALISRERGVVPITNQQHLYQLRCQSHPVSFRLKESLVAGRVNEVSLIVDKCEQQVSTSVDTTFCLRLEMIHYYLFAPEPYMKGRRRRRPGEGAREVRRGVLRMLPRGGLDESSGAA